MKISITGHRPEKLANFEWVDSTLAETFQELQPEIIFTGMAAGVDLLAADIANRLNIEYIAARPWAGHKPRQEDEDLYRKIISYAKEVINVDKSETYPGVWVYHNRNKLMVDRSDLLVAVWDGSSTGGTASCVKYAQSLKRTIIQLNPKLMTIKYMTPNKPDLTLF